MAPTSYSQSSPPSTRPISTQASVTYARESSSSSICHTRRVVAAHLGPHVRAPSSSSPPRCCCWSPPHGNRPLHSLHAEPDAPLRLLAQRRPGPRRRDVPRARADRDCGRVGRWKRAVQRAHDERPIGANVASGASLLGVPRAAQRAARVLCVDRQEVSWLPQLREGAPAVRVPPQARVHERDAGRDQLPQESARQLHGAARFPHVHNDAQVPDVQQRAVHQCARLADVGDC